MVATGGPDKLGRQFTVPPSAFASATVDGRVTASDGYTEFASMSNGTDSVGKLFFAQDASNFYFAPGSTALRPAG